MIKEFVIFKNKEVKSDKHPTHRINVKINEQFVELGACWSKTSKNNEKFLSCKLRDVYVDKEDRTKTRKGFSIVEDGLNIHRVDNSEELGPF